MTPTFSLYERHWINLGTRDRQCLDIGLGICRKSRVRFSVEKSTRSSARTQNLYCALNDLR